MLKISCSEFSHCNAYEANLKSVEDWYQGLRVSGGFKKKGPVSSLWWGPLTYSCWSEAQEALHLRDAGVDVPPSEV